MKPFLEELAEKIISRHPRLEEVTMVFPNRRAALFFHHYLSKHITQPAWSPKLKTIEELFHELSELQEADRLSLIFKLYRVYRKLINPEESFDKFYFWGEMLLRDFEEVDKYLIPAALLFKDLSQLRELDERFDYLTEEQKKFLRDFWLNFEDKPAGSKEEFLKVWRELPTVYRDFVKSLRSENLGYEGMIHRDVAEKILNGKFARPKGSKNPASEVIFAGFNALTKSEEVLITHFVNGGAQVFWDLDAYYVEDSNQEAGQFFRQYSRHTVLGSTFDPGLASNFKNAEKIVDLYGVPQKVGQAKLLGQLLKSDELSEEQEALKTVIVLPDESMLLSVMHSLPEALESVNVTMGYPLRNTPLCNLLELLLDLQINRRGDTFSHRQVTAILAHAYVLSQDEVNATHLRLNIIHRNRVYIAAAELQKEKSILELLFQPVKPEGIATYLLEIVQTLGASFSDRQSFDREYAYHFHRHLSRLHEVLNDASSPLDLKGFQKLFRQVIQSQKIPFTGEPLKGLQIMGVLETRNLDFDNVFILSLNEGSLPAAPRQGSYIPTTLRKAYGLPTHEHQDAMAAYLFYRILQRARTIKLFYNTEPDVLGTGEMSRFVQQLIHESGWEIKHHILSNPIQIAEVKPIEVAKTPEVIAAFVKYTDPQGKGISPSALNDYIECRLRYYLKYIARMEEAKEVEEDVDARIFGNFLHNVMDWFYHELIDRKKSRDITPEDLHPANVDELLEPLIDRAFRQQYDPESTESIEYRGQRVVVRAIVRQFAQRILALDRDHAPFTIELIEEKKFNAPLVIPGLSQPVIISGRIDRIDSKDGLVRVIDYKTGKDELSMDSIASLFTREGKRNKAAFQTILYSWLYHQNETNSGPIVPMLMNRKNLFKEEGLKPFSMARQGISDIRPYLPEFEKRLKTLLEELYNPDMLFTQTSETSNCKFCLYKNMCRR
jgi:hypothetical protein